MARGMYVPSKGKPEALLVDRQIEISELLESDQYDVLPVPGTKLSFYMRPQRTEGLEKNLGASLFLMKETGLRLALRGPIVVLYEALDGAS